MNTKGFTCEVEGEDKEFIVRNPSLDDQREGPKNIQSSFH